jgi:hypothetical protein
MYGNHRGVKQKTTFHHASLSEFYPRQQFRTLESVISPKAHFLTGHAGAPALWLKPAPLIRRHS